MIQMGFPGVRIAATALLLSQGACINGSDSGYPGYTAEVVAPTDPVDIAAQYVPLASTANVVSQIAGVGTINSTSRYAGVGDSFPVRFSVGRYEMTRNHANDSYRYVPQYEGYEYYIEDFNPDDYALTLSASESNGQIVYRDRENEESTVARSHYIVTQPDRVSGTYDYVTPVFFRSQISRPYSATFMGNTGFLGVATAPGDMPNSGTATFTGEAMGDVSRQTYEPVYEGAATYTHKTYHDAALVGAASVRADFGAGTVDVAMTGLTATDRATGAPLTTPIDTVNLTGMTIDGNTFNGGSIEVLKDGASVEAAFGKRRVHQAGGTFFGYDAATQGPDEVAGAASTLWDSQTERFTDHQLETRFIAD